MVDWRGAEREIAIEFRDRSERIRLAMPAQSFPRPTRERKPANRSSKDRSRGKFAQTRNGEGNETHSN